MRDAPPDKRASRPTAGPESALRRLFGQPLALEHETAVFILVSFADFLLTVVLLHSGRFVESNPVARRVIAAFGLHGLVVFKFGSVAVICVLAQVIARRRSQTARVLLESAALLLGGMILCILVLAFRTALAG
jgi:hypothetical protein